MNVIRPWDNDPPTCFCEHCARAAARPASIRIARGKGFAALHSYVQGRWPASRNPPTASSPASRGSCCGIRRFSAWEYQYRLGREAIGDGDVPAREGDQADGRSRLARRPSAVELGHRLSRRDELRGDGAAFRLHQVHRVSQRALAAHSRLVSAAIPEDDPGRGVARDVARAVLRLFGYDKNVEPTLDELGRRGFSPEYVYRETKHSVASANGKTKIYTGVGFDVPGSPPDDPETVYQATSKALRGRRRRHRRLARVRGDEGGESARGRPRVSRGHAPGELRRYALTSVAARRASRPMLKIAPRVSYVCPTKYRPG